MMQLNFTFYLAPDLTFKIVKQKCVKHFANVWQADCWTGILSGGRTLDTMLMFYCVMTHFLIDMYDQSMNI